MMFFVAWFIFNAHIAALVDWRSSMKNAHDAVAVVSCNLAATFSD